jgi:hypothetical protein
MWGGAQIGARCAAWLAGPAAGEVGRTPTTPTLLRSTRITSRPRNPVMFRASLNTIHAVGRLGSGVAQVSHPLARGLDSAAGGTSSAPGATKDLSASTSLRSTRSALASRCCAPPGVGFSRRLVRRSKLTIRPFHRFCEATSRRAPSAEPERDLTDSFVPSDGRAAQQSGWTLKPPPLFALPMRGRVRT